MVGVSIFEAIVLGLVQGVTEFLPVSSSGHLLVIHNIFGSTGSTLGFDVALHTGTLLALVLYFKKDLWQYLVNVGRNNPIGREARLLIYATVPAAVGGFLFSDYIDNKFRAALVVAITLFTVGVLMLVVDRNNEKAKTEKVNTKQGMIIGFSQALALVPGVSRSGITMVSGIFSGLNRAEAARFSFLLAIPIIAGSALGIILKDPGSVTGSGSIELFVGVVSAFLSGILAIKFFLRVVSRVGLKPFAIYRMLLAVIVIVFLV